MHTRTSRPHATDSSHAIPPHTQPPGQVEATRERPSSIPHDLSHVDLFAHAPQRPPVKMGWANGYASHNQGANRAASPITTTTAIANQQIIQRLQFEYASTLAWAGSLMYIEDKDATRWKQEFADLQQAVGKIEKMSHYSTHLTPENLKLFTAIQAFVADTKDAKIKASDRQTVGKQIGDYLSQAKVLYQKAITHHLETISSDIQSKYNSVTKHYNKIWGNLSQAIKKFDQDRLALQLDSGQDAIDQLIAMGNKLIQDVGTKAKEQTDRDQQDAQDAKDRQAAKSQMTGTTINSPDSQPQLPLNSGKTSTPPPNAGKQEQEPLPPVKTDTELTDETRQEIQKIRRDPNQIKGADFDALYNSLAKLDRLTKGYDKSDQTKRQKAKKALKAALQAIQNNPEYGLVSQVVPLPLNPLVWNASQAYEAIHTGQLNNANAPVSLDLNRTYQSNYEGENGIGGEYVPNATINAWVVHVHRGPNGGLKAASTKTWLNRFAGMSSHKLTKEKAISAGIPDTDTTQQNHNQNVGRYG